MIKVVQGTVGVRIGGRNTTRSIEDPPFSLSEEAEARFVKLGVAVYHSSGVMGPEAEAVATSQQTDESEVAADTEETAADTEETSADAEETAPEEDDTLESMSFSELQELAKQMGLSAGGKREDLLARINEANKVTM